MTMTESEFDALLRSAGDELDARSAAHVVVDGAPEHRSRRHLAGIAAVGLVAASIAALVVVANVRDGSNDTTITPANTSPPSSTELDPATFAGVRVCADALAEYSVPGGIGEVPVPDPATADILLLDIPGQPTHVRVMMIGNGAVYSCTVDRDIEADRGIVSDALSVAPAEREPAADGVVLDDLQITGGEATGPGSFIAIGRAGDQVASVSVDLPDGTSYASVPTAGRFVVEGAIPTGVPLFDQDVSWTLVSGAERSSRADLLDDDSGGLEECAAEPACVETRVMDLQARAVDWPEQAAILADGVVTDQEHAAANQRFVDCLVEAGLDAKVLGSGHVVTDGPTQEQRPAVIGCGVQHLDLVGELFDQQDAQRRVADD
jgi:hypothetical protein